MTVKLKLTALAAAIVLVCALVPVTLASPGSAPARRDFYVKARQYAFDPPRIIVNKGDTVHIRLTSVDVVHGFFLEGYDLDALVEPGQLGFQLRYPSKGRDFAPVEELAFTAAKTGKFRYRCSHTCGNLHPFMQGELIVRPNYPFLAAIGGTVGILIAAFTVILLSTKTNRIAQQPNHPQEDAL